MLRVLRYRDFALAWSGGLISMIGTWALWITLPIHVYGLSGSSLATSAVVAAVVVPGVLLGSVAGIFVDRWNRRTTLIVTNLLLAASVLPLLLVGESTLWLVYPVILVSATLSQFSEPAENAFLPRLVPSDDLIAANSLNAWNNNLARLAGPALGGGLYAATGLTGVVLADAASFLAVAVLLAFVRTSGAVERTADAASAAFRSWRRAWHEWREGLGVVAGERAVGVVFAVQAITAVGEGVFGVMFVVWVRDVLEGGAPELGWLQTSQAVGGLLGGFVSVYAGKRLVPERSFGLALVAFGVFDLLLFNYPLLLTGVWIGSALMILVGIPTASVYAARTTILQTHVEDAYRGRIFGSLGTTAALLTLVGTGIAGAMGDVLGPIALLNIQGSAYVVAGLFALIALAPSMVSAAPRRADADSAA
jgi:MFS family permease